jgi:hypothetical protein
MRMRRIFYYGLYLNKGTIFEKKKKLLKIRFVFCTTFVWKFSNSKKKLVRYDQKCILDFKLFLSDFNETSNLSSDCRNIFK